MQKHQYVGKTLDDALAQAANDLGTQKENIRYNILPSEGGSLLKKLLFKSIKVEAWVEKTEDLQEAARQAVREAIEGGNQRQANGANKKNSRVSHQRTEPQPDKRSASSGSLEPTKHKKASPPREEKEAKKQNSARTPSTQKAHQPQADREAKKGNMTRQANLLARSAEGQTRTEAETSQNTISFDTPGVKELLIEYTNAFVKVFEAEAQHVKYERTEKGDMKVSVASPMLEDLLARSDRLSGSYEHVFKRIAQKKLGDLPERLYLNAGDAANKRAENLQEMARSMAEKVKQTGRSITVNSKSGQERRIIHVTIDEIEGVATRSVGTGEGRKLVIYSTEAKHRRKNSKRQQPETASTENGSGHAEREGASRPGHTDEAAGTGPSKRAAGARRSRSRRGRHRSSTKTAAATPATDSHGELSARAPSEDMS